MDPHFPSPPPSSSKEASAHHVLMIMAPVAVGIISILTTSPNATFRVQGSSWDVVSLAVMAVALLLGLCNTLWNPSTSVPNSTPTTTTNTSPTVGDDQRHIAVIRPTVSDNQQRITITPPMVSGNRRRTVTPTVLTVGGDQLRIATTAATALPTVVGDRQHTTTPLQTVGGNRRRITTTSPRVGSDRRGFLEMKFRSESAMPILGSGSDRRSVKLTNAGDDDTLHGRHPVGSWLLDQISPIHYLTDDSSIEGSPIRLTSDAVHYHYYYSGNRPALPAVSRRHRRSSSVDWQENLLSQTTTRPIIRSGSTPAMYCDPSFSSSSHPWVGPYNKPNFLAQGSLMNDHAEDVDADDEKEEGYQFSPPSPFDQHFDLADHFVLEEEPTPIRMMNKNNPAAIETPSSIPSSKAAVSGKSFLDEIPSSPNTDCSVNEKADDFIRRFRENIRLQRLDSLERHERNGAWGG